MKTSIELLNEAYEYCHSAPGWCLFLLDEARTMIMFQQEKGEIELLYAEISMYIGEEREAISIWEKVEKNSQLYPYFAGGVAALNLSIFRDKDEEHGWTGFEEFLDPRNAPD